MRPMAILALAALLVALAGCGGGSSGSTGASGPTTAAGDPADGDGSGARAATVDPCRAQLGEFVDSLEALRKRLEVGLDYAGYVAAVGKVRAIYERVPVEGIGVGCLVGSGTPAERAFNRYIAAANEWGECLTEAGCSGGSIEAELQAQWHAAARLLAGVRAES